MSIYNSPSRLLKNNQRYDHDLNYFDEFSPKILIDKRKLYKNNDIDPHIVSQTNKNKLDKLNTFNANNSPKQNFSKKNIINNKGIVHSHKKILFSNFSIKEQNSNNFKSSNSDAMSNKHNESLSLVITSNKNLSNNKNFVINNNNNFRCNQEINLDFNLNSNNNENNFNSGSSYLRKSKSSEKNKSLNFNNNNYNINSNTNKNLNNYYNEKIKIKADSSNISYKYENLQYKKFSSFTSKNFNFMNKQNSSNNSNKNLIKINENYKTNENLNKKRIYIESVETAGNREIHSSRRLNYRSDGFSSKESLQIKSKKFLIMKKSKILQKALTAKSKLNNKESEKTINSHYKKSIINNYFEKKESERNQHNINNNDKETDFIVKRLNSALAPGEAEKKGFFITSGKAKPKEKEDGIFMLKKDYFIQTLFEKNESAKNVQNFIEELGQVQVQELDDDFKSDITGRYNKKKKINFTKIKIENELDKSENFPGNNFTSTNKNNNKNNFHQKHKHNFFRTSININSTTKQNLNTKETKSKYRLKSSKNFLSNVKSALPSEEKAINPKKFQETFAVRNFSNFKLIPKTAPMNPMTLIKHYRKELSSGAYSHSSSNYMQFDNMSAQGRNCYSAFKAVNVNNSFSKEKQQQQQENIIFGSSFSKSNKNNTEFRNRSVEHDRKNASLIISRNNNNYNNNNNFLSLNLKNENINNNNNTNCSNANIFYFDKASKLSYYHARELSAYSRGRRKRKTNSAENLQSDLEHWQSNYQKEKGLQTTLNLNIKNFKSAAETSKKPLITIHPYNFNEENLNDQNFDNKLFSNDYIKGNFIKDKDSLYNEADRSINDENNNHEKLTIETLQIQDKEEKTKDIDKVSQDNNDHNEIKNNNNSINENIQKKTNINDQKDFTLSKLKLKNLSQKHNIPNKTSQNKTRSEAKLNKNLGEFESNKAQNKILHNNKNNLSSSNNANNLGSGESNFHRIKKISSNRNRLSSLVTNNNFNNINNNLNPNYLKIKNQINYEKKQKELLTTKQQIDNLYEKLSANKKGKSKAIEYLYASNSLTKHMSNKLINPIYNSNKTNNSKSQNKNNSIEKTCNNLNIKEEELIQSTKDNNNNNNINTNTKNNINNREKEKESLNEFLKANPYLDSDQFNFNNYTNENLSKEEKEKNNLNNKNINIIPNKKIVKIDRGFQSDLDYVTNQNLQKLRRLKAQNANKTVQNRNAYSSYDQLKKKKLDEFNLNEYLYSRNIDYKKISNFNLTNERLAPKSATGFSHKKANFNFNNGNNSFVSKPPPNNFRNVFTAGKIKLSTMILSNVKV